MTHEIEVLVDGKSLPMNDFVANMVGETVAAMVGSLKGGENAREIRILLTRK